MDIRKLQRVIVDALEDVKAQQIVVFNTEEQSPLFERVIVASGTSNRQTKALASSVRDAVKAEGYSLPRVEGEENGEWIIVDCGAAVVHVMQPDIRDYYHLEEIWGAKPVRLKLGAAPAGLVKASTRSEGDAGFVTPTKRTPSKKAVAQKVAAKKVPAKKAPARAPTAKAAPARAPAKKPAVKKTSATQKTTTLVVNQPRPAASAAPAAKKAIRPVAKKTRTRE